MRTLRTHRTTILLRTTAAHTGTCAATADDQTGPSNQFGAALSAKATTKASAQSTKRANPRASAPCQRKPPQRQPINNPQNTRIIRSLPTHWDKLQRIISTN
jgi:hypothetical protein